MPVVGVEGRPLHNQENNRAGMCPPHPFTFAQWGKLEPIMLLDIYDEECLLLAQSGDPSLDVVQGTTV